MDTKKKEQHIKQPCMTFSNTPKSSRQVCDFAHNFYKCCTNTWKKNQVEKDCFKNTITQNKTAIKKQQKHKTYKTRKTRKKQTNTPPSGQIFVFSFFHLFNLFKSL